VASGNDAYANAISSPACISSAISVGATDEHDEVPIYSNEADILDLLAPGGDFNTDTGVTSSVPGNTYSAFQGTSMATPHVTGAWALLKEAHPTATVDEVLSALINTGVPVLEPFAGLTKPRIQIEAALDALDNPQIFCGRNILEFATVITGTSGDDILFGTSGDDLIDAKEGNDSVQGLDGDDCLIGGDGADRLSGGNGNDYLQGDAGDDSLNGGAGDDSLHGGLDNDTLSGSAGIDTLNGDDGNDSLKGGLGNDFLFGGAGDDILSGGDDNDSLDGGANNDYVLGRDGDDTMLGGSGGTDVCVGGAGSDTGDVECEIVV
jgi:Ca2+-binding RTX toxin-like protein